MRLWATYRAGKSADKDISVGVVFAVCRAEGINA